MREVALPSGLRYTDLRVGGGAPPRRGDLVVLHYRGWADGEGGVRGVGIRQGAEAQPRRCGCAAVADGRWGARAAPALRRPRRRAV